MKKKLVSALLITGMLSSMFAGCGKSAGGGGAVNADGIKEFTAFFAVPGNEINNDNEIQGLIAEKTGPHFAVGDTCYSHAEDVPMYNPDGKECVARDNSCSILRKTDISKAYFNCHTDITIPYYELGDITVITADGKELPIIVEGRFVVPGTEELNIVLDQNI